MRGHDRFESLAGAVALGEASAVELEEVQRHAIGCEQCRADLDGAAPIVARLTASRDGERWQPSLGGAVSARVRERSASRSRLAIATLGWAAGLSIAGNLAVVTGFAGTVVNAFAPAPAPVAFHVIRLPAATFAHLRSPRVPVVAQAAPGVALRAARYAPHATARSLAVAPERPVARVAAPPEPIDPLADVLADERGTHQRLAVESSIGSGTALQP